MFENGIYAKHSEAAVHFLKRKISINHKFGTKVRPLTLSRMSGVFLLLVHGGAICCAVFVLEILWKLFALERIIGIKKKNQRRTRRKYQNRSKGAVRVSFVVSTVKHFE